MIEHSRKSEEYQTGLDYATDSWLHFIIDLIGNENHQLATVIGQDIALLVDHNKLSVYLRSVLFYLSSQRDNQEMEYHFYRYRRSV